MGYIWRRSCKWTRPVRKSTCSMAKAHASVHRETCVRAHVVEDVEMPHLFRVKVSVADIPSWLQTSPLTPLFSLPACMQQSASVMLCCVVLSKQCAVLFKTISMPTLTQNFQLHKKQDKWYYVLTLCSIFLLLFFSLLICFLHFVVSMMIKT